MAFRFDFPDPVLSDEKNDSVDQKNIEQTTLKKLKQGSDTTSKIVTAPCEEIYYSDEVIEEVRDIPTTTYAITEDFSVTCYISDVLADIYSTSNPDSSLAKVVSSNVDVVPDEYEGGLTVWESCIDLSEFLVSENVELKNKVVMELGCGAGIPGICAIKRGAKEVHFQDFNSEVIKHYTIPNVMKLNSHSECKCRFFSGDWENFSITLGHMIRDRSSEKYDVVLTAETIYNPDNYHKLHKVFEALLSYDGCVYPFCDADHYRCGRDSPCLEKLFDTPTHGQTMIWISTKSHYFGATSRLGGGTNMFMEYLEKNGVFKASVCKIIDAAIPREILKIEWKKENT